MARQGASTAQQGISIVHPAHGDPPVPPPPALCGPTVPSWTLLSRCTNTGGSWAGAPGQAESNASVPQLSNEDVPSFWVSLQICAPVV